MKVFQREILLGEDILHEGIEWHRIAAVQRSHPFGCGFGNGFVADFDAQFILLLDQQQTEINLPLLVEVWIFAAAIWPFAGGEKMGQHHFALGIDKAALANGLAVDHAKVAAPTAGPAAGPFMAEPQYTNVIMIAAMMIHHIHFECLRIVPIIFFLAKSLAKTRTRTLTGFALPGQRKKRLVSR
ncbi:MAG: hypothetical protein V9H26_23100 [Verrucomicrobiota bacterium]